MRLKVNHWLLLLPLVWLSVPVSGAEAQTNKQTAATLYKNECASCHMAYPPELLPARSWQAILNRLDRHFGDNASLDPVTLKTLGQYLQTHSADAVATRRSRRVLRSIPADNTPLRISQVPYIQHKHREIPTRYIRANPQVKSLSHCVACHQGAERGVFSEHSVRIPGYGRWDD